MFSEFPLFNISVYFVPCCIPQNTFLFVVSSGHGLKLFHFQVLSVWQNTLFNLCPTKVVNSSVSLSSPTVSSCSLYSLTWTLMVSPNNSRVLLKFLPSLFFCHLPVPSTVPPTVSFIHCVLLTVSWHCASIMLAHFHCSSQ